MAKVRINKSITLINGDLQEIVFVAGKIYNSVPDWLAKELKAGEYCEII